ncbi:Bug family tripartite tricarboxylate transporter substrate binding protein [Bosea beijingensis]|jgi:putative tricarboxylic transport membrane protein|nr:tripartite tricarboxylate transporter substrate binding protein [Pseudomonadota bacterium]
MLTSILKRTALTAVALAALSTAAFAQLNELKIMAPAAPGGGWDGTARSMQQAMTAAGIVKSVQVNNVTGAGGTIGLAQLIGAKGAGDQLMVNGFVMVGAILLNKSPVNLTQITPIARLTAEAEVIVVPTESPLKTAKDLAERLKADPAKVTWAGGSAGGTDHILAALFAQAVGADAKKINYIPFSGGGEALAAMLGGRVTAGVSGYGEFEGQIKAGKLRVLAVSSSKRLENAPDAPTLKEQGIDLELLNWRSVVAPPGLSAEQTKALTDSVEKMVKSKEWQEILKARGWDNAFLPGAAFDTFLKGEIERVGKVMTEVGLVK